METYVEINDNNSFHTYSYQYFFYYTMKQANRKFVMKSNYATSKVQRYIIHSSVTTCRIFVGYVSNRFIHMTHEYHAGTRPQINSS